jgi:hypothetical protein
MEAQEELIEVQCTSCNEPFAYDPEDDIVPICGNWIVQCPNCGTFYNVKPIEYE